MQQTLFNTDYHLNSWVQQVHTKKSWQSAYHRQQIYCLIVIDTESINQTDTPLLSSFSSLKLWTAAVQSWELGVTF